MTVVPRRKRTPRAPSRSMECKSARRIPTHGPIAPHTASRSTSARSRPRCPESVDRSYGPIETSPHRQCPTTGAHAHRWRGGKCRFPPVSTPLCVRRSPRRSRAHARRGQARVPRFLRPRSGRTVARTRSDSEARPASARPVYARPRYYGWARRVVACLRRFFVRECSNEECGGASHWNPDTLVTHVAFVCGASLFLKEEQRERGESQWIKT